MNRNEIFIENFIRTFKNEAEKIKVDEIMFAQFLAESCNIVTREVISFLPDIHKDRLDDFCMHLDNILKVQNMLIIANQLIDLEKIWSERETSKTV